MKDIALQIAVKAVNDTVGPDRLVLTLLVFRVYLYITELDLPVPSIIQYTVTI